MLNYSKISGPLIANISFRYRSHLYHYIAEDAIPVVARGRAIRVSCVHMVFSACAIAAVERNTTLDLGLIDVADDAVQHVA